jgi:hypothetical protein
MVAELFYANSIPVVGSALVKYRCFWPPAGFAGRAFADLKLSRGTERECVHTQQRRLDSPPENARAGQAGRS